MEIALKNMDFTGKFMRIVATYESTGLDIPNDVKRVCKDATVRNDSIPIHGLDCKNVKRK